MQKVSSRFLNDFWGNLGAEHPQRELLGKRGIWKCTEAHLCSRTEDQHAGSRDLPGASKGGKKTCLPREEEGKISTGLRRTGIGTVKERLAWC